MISDMFTYLGQATAVFAGVFTAARFAEGAKSETGKVVADTMQGSVAWAGDKVSQAGQKTGEAFRRKRQEQAQVTTRTEEGETVTQFTLSAEEIQQLKDLLASLNTDNPPAVRIAEPHPSQTIQ